MSHLSICPKLKRRLHKGLRYIWIAAVFFAGQHKIQPPIFLREFFWDDHTDDVMMNIRQQWEHERRLRPRWTRGNHRFVRTKFKNNNTPGYKFLKQNSNTPRGYKNWQKPTALKATAHAPTGLKFEKKTTGHRIWISKNGALAPWQCGFSEKSCAWDCPQGTAHLEQIFVFVHFFFFLPSWYFFSSFSQERLAMSLLLCRLVFLKSTVFCVSLQMVSVFFLRWTDFFSPFRYFTTCLNPAGEWVFPFSFWCKTLF